MRTIRTIAFASLLSISASCTLPRQETAVLFRTEDMQPETRSLLTAPDIETRKTGITLAAYEAGSLVTSAYFTQQFDAMPLHLERGVTYAVYALVNMGDLRSSLPASEAGLAALAYRIPSYTDGSGSLAARGLPMAGKLDYGGGPSVIPVERLLAKVTVHLSCEWTGASIREVHVGNLNRVLRPFGNGAAGQADDLLDGQEFQSGTAAASGTFVFYVPENLQGTLPGITDSEGKSPDRSGEVAARRDRLTYLETVVDASGQYKGSITYRSYLGRDAVSNFDIRRNAHYVWTVRYLEDGLQLDDWKHGNDLMDPSGLDIDDEWDDGGESELD